MFSNPIGNSIWLRSYSSSIGLRALTLVSEETVAYP
jgi:hypothetical protein